MGKPASFKARLNAFSTFARSRNVPSSDGNTQIDRSFPCLERCRLRGCIVALENVTKPGAPQRSARRSRAGPKSRLADWRFARELEAFASAVRTRMTSAGRPIQPESPTGRWLEWADIVSRYYDKQAIDKLLVLRQHERGYALRAKFGWAHTVTTRDALKVFFAPIKELEQELRANAERQD